MSFLPQYLARIGLPPLTAAPYAATHATLAAIQLAHLRSIPFENIDVVLRRPIAMGLPEVTDKLIHQGRGGYCFEQNTLLLEALRLIGFDAKPVLARVRWNRPPDVDTPYTHMVLVVSTEGGEYAVDVGFGGLQALVPLRLNEETTTPDGDRYLLTADSTTGYFTAQWSLKDAWVPMYKFRNVSALNCDMVVANHWSCSWPEARWVACLFAARVIGAERHHLLNNEHCVRRADGTATRTTLGSGAEVVALLESVFGVVVPEDADMTLIEAMVKKGAQEKFHAPSYAT